MILTPEQLELLFYLLAALGIGFFFGYFLSRAFAREKYEPEIEDLVSTLDDKDSEIERASQKHGQLKQHLTIQTSELESVKHQMLDMQDVIKNSKKSTELLENEKNKLEEILDQKDKHLNEQSEEIRFSRNELIDAQNLIDEFKSVNNHQKEEIVVTQVEIEKNVKLNQELSKKIQICLDNEKKLIDQKDILSKNINEKEARVEELEKKSDQLDKANLTNQHFEEKIRNISKEVEGNKSAMTELANKNSLLQKSVIEKQKKFDQKNGELIRLQGEIKPQKDFSNSIKMDDARIDTLEKEISYLQDNILQRDEALKKLEKKLHVSEIQLENVSKVAQNIKNQTNNIVDIDKKSRGWGLGDLAFVKLAKNAIDKFSDDHSEKEPVKNLYGDKQAQNKNEQKLKLYKSDILKLYGSVDNNLLDRLVVEFGDLETEQIDCANKDELIAVRENFLKKRLTLKESDQQLDNSILNICEKMREKKDRYRVTFYYLLIKYYNKELMMLS